MAETAVRGDKHLLEVLGLDRALVFAEQLATDFRSSAMPLREVDLRNLHRFTLQAESYAGAYKEKEVGIVGTDGDPVRTTPIIDVQHQMYELVNWFNESNAQPVLSATVIHSWLTVIHPFEDGNGRVARLLANVALLRAGWPPLIVRSADRSEYLDALSYSDSGGDVLPLFDLFAKSVMRGLKEISKPDLARRMFEADLRSRPSDRYNLWWSYIDQFLRELLSELRDWDQRFDVFRMSRPPESTYLLLEDRDASGNTWLAKIKLGPDIDILVWLGWRTEELGALSQRQPAPAIFLSIRDKSESPAVPYLPPWLSSPFELSELVIYPTTHEKVAELRYGSVAYRSSIGDAASFVAREIADYARSAG
jgi:fido (protein-threonine AMPylation protein)